MSTDAWENTTHDWSGGVDTRHLDEVRERPDPLQPNGTTGSIVRFQPFSDVAALGQADIASLAVARTPALELVLLDLRQVLVASRQLQPHTTDGSSPRHT